MPRGAEVFTAVASEDAWDTATVGPASRGVPLLRRALNIYDGIGVSVGIMIGSGIFASPGVTLSRCGSPGAALLAWVASAALVLCASFCYAELATSIPDSGGDFAFLQRAYGDAVAFCFAWYNFWVGKTGSQAIISTIFSHYFISGLFGSHFLSTHDGVIAAKITAILLLLALCVLNCAGVKESAAVINGLTAVKLVLVASLIVAAIAYVMATDDSTARSNLDSENAFTGTSFSGFATGMIPALWSFDGWADVNFMAEELVNPQRLLPRIIFTSVLVVATAYVCANIAYLSVLNTSTIKNSHSVAMDFGDNVAGRWFSILMSFGVALSAAGSANGSVMTGGRAFYAVARAGRGPLSLSILNDKGSPMVALVTQMMWSVVLLCIPRSNFSTLLDYFGPASWMFYALTGFGVVVLRRCSPDMPRPYRVPWYPIPPAVLCLVSIFIVCNALLSSPLFTVLALCFISFGIPVFYFCYGPSCKLPFVRQSENVGKIFSLWASPTTTDLSHVVQSETTSSSPPVHTSPLYFAIDGLVNNIEEEY